MRGWYGERKVSIQDDAVDVIVVPVELILMIDGETVLRSWRMAYQTRDVYFTAGLWRDVFP